MAQQGPIVLNERLLRDKFRRDVPHLSEQEAVELGCAIARLLEAYQPERIYLFGSKARGDAGPDSDYDLMIVVPDEAPPERGRSRLAYEVLWETGFAADVLVWRRSTFERQAPVVASLPATVLREGRLLYAA